MSNQLISRHWLLTATSEWLANFDIQCIEIQPNTINLSTRPWQINPRDSAFVSKSLALRSTVLGWILMYIEISPLIKFITLSYDNPYSWFWRQNRRDVVVPMTQHNVDVKSTVGLRWGNKAKRKILAQKNYTENILIDKHLTACADESQVTSLPALIHHPGV